MTKTIFDTLKTYSIALGFATCVTLASGAEDQQPITPDHFPIDATDMDRSQQTPVTSYAEPLSKVQDSVVAVYTLKKVSGRRYMDPREEMLRRFFGAPPQQETPDAEEEVETMPAGQGSGVIISSDGYVLTNNHVISDRSGKKVDEVLVTLNDGEEYEAEIIGFDEKTDVAVLKIDATNLPCAQMADSDNLRIGDVVFAIGNPMGVGKTVTMGIVSATSRDLNILGNQGYESFIQTDASINMGNSGGALVDAWGRLIGINTAIISQSGGNIGIGFAVPIKLARSIAISLATTGEVRRGLLGISPGKIDAALAESFGLESTEGAIVNQVTEDLPAGKAGVEVGDIVLKINDQKIKDADHLRLVVAGYQPGTEVELLILRDGKEKKIKVALADFDDPYGTGISRTSEILPGVEGKELTKELREQFEIPADISGVLINDIRGDSPYSRALAEGILILRVNGQDVETVNEVRSALKPGINRLYVFHRGNFGFIAVKVQ